MITYDYVLEFSGRGGFSSVSDVSCGKNMFLLHGECKDAVNTMY